MATPEYARSDGNANQLKLIVGDKVQDEWWVHAHPITDPTESIEYGLAFSTSIANMWATAPDLLEVAEDVVNIFGSNAIAFRSLADKARAAIAKAKGKL